MGTPAGPLRVPVVALALGQRVLDAASGRYVARVHRKSVGDALLLVDHSGSAEADAVVESVSPEVVVSVSAVRAVESVQPFRVVVLQALGKADKIDEIARDLTEIGAAELWPMTTRRTVVKLAGKEEARLERWRRVVVEASRQANRADTLIIAPVQPFARALAAITADVRLILSPRAVARLSDVALPPGATVAVAIGPEGGFHEEELDEAERAGFQAVVTGSTILRTETAGPAVAAALLYR